MRFEDLNAWQAARELTRAVYALSKSESLRTDAALKGQLQRAAVSVMSNIAEGFERSHKQEKLNFLNIARASCGEVRSLSYVCEDCGLVGVSPVRELRERAVSTGQLISGFIRSLQRQSPIEP
jgi:four helix bundle protein